ncbi:MAG: RpiB/LacA/LacB family sugar-phosphate isomerase [Candidatus Campbellbacteria bacterium]|nr:RpiB/LacA/LacB family sugar-phosphate isomerase [Candidatus Campbellbacteria bacterium]
MKIFLATDHAGFKTKEEVKSHLSSLGYEVEDCGAYELNPDDDYPDFISKAAEEVSKEPDTNRAVIFGGSGQGEAIVANKFKGVRAAVFYGGEDKGKIVTLSREHNDANIISLGARFITIEEAKRIVEIWLDEPFSGEDRHKRRIEKITKIENEHD